MRQPHLQLQRRRLSNVCQGRAETHTQYIYSLQQRMNERTKKIAVCIWNNREMKCEKMSSYTLVRWIPHSVVCSVRILYVLAVRNNFFLFKCRCTVNENWEREKKNCFYRRMYLYSFMLYVESAAVCSMIKYWNDYVWYMRVHSLYDTICFFFLFRRCLRFKFKVRFMDFHTIC